MKRTYQQKEYYTVEQNYKPKTKEQTTLKIKLH